MLQIRTMRARDLAFAIRLTDQEKWGVTREDLRRILGLNPEGSFIAMERSKRIGFSTTVAYGKTLGWIGNVIVDRTYRGRHVGRALVRNAVEHLQRAQVKKIGLYSFDDNVRFYLRLGFTRDAPFVRLGRKPMRTTPTRPGDEASRTLPLRLAFSADRIAFGADRSKLIRMVLGTKGCWYLGSSNGRSANSYLLVKEYAETSELGPWVCIRPHGAQPTQMLRLALSMIAAKPIEVSCLPNHREALALLKKEGFQAINHGYRMYLGKVSRIGDDKASYALGFLDKG